MVVPLIALKVPTDYQAQYDDYWTTPARIGESSGDMELTADQIVMSCGVGRTLDVGSGEGILVACLLQRGVDAHGLDVSEVVVSRCNQRIPKRFTQGSVLSLPFADESFDTVVSADCMEHLAPEDVPRALKEIHRVARRYVFLKLATTQDRDSHWHLTVEGRGWWETKCFEAGFRKHPAYYKVNAYELLNHDGWQIVIPLEKIPTDTLLQYPLSALEGERGLHMDMTRDFGERSDAHIIRYQWACNYIKSGDRVLDAACGLGYGSHTIKNLTRGTKITGIDGSSYAVDYARKNFPCAFGRVDYRLGILPNSLAIYPDNSFEIIISFETLEHVEAPVALLLEFFRLLTPGGRVIVSVPNDWSDETGEDPNPFHLHVYDWARLKLELSANFILEDAYAQTASQCKISAKGSQWEKRKRSLHSVALEAQSPADCEWWLMTAMKSPLNAEQPYSERAFPNLLSTEHPSIRYEEYFINPWLMHAMVNSEYRIKNSAALERLTTDVMAAYPLVSNDYKAALCVRAYIVFQCADYGLKQAMISDINRVSCGIFPDPMALRWAVSLLFVKAKLLEASGDLIAAKETFSECSHIDVREFGIHLSTKTTEAAYLAGKLAYSLGELSEAKRCWQDGVVIGDSLLKVDLADVLINPDFPNLFNHGDGVREYAVAWDNIARCANGLHLLRLSGPIDYSTLNNCHQTEYAGVTADLEVTRLVLVERTQTLEHTTGELQQRTEELVHTRQTLVERTQALEHTTGELQHRTEELVRTRQTLAERTQTLEHTTGELQHRTEELVRTRQTLAERTQTLEHTTGDLQQRTEELVHTRQTLIERTQALERTTGDLQQRTEELVHTRQTLVERTQALERTTSELQQRTAELVQTRQTLA